MHESTSPKNKPLPAGYDLWLHDAAAMAGASERTVRRWAQTGRRDRGVLHSVETVHGLAFRSADVAAYTDIRAVEPGARSTRARLNDAISAVVAEAPRLSQGQRTKLALALAGASSSEGVR